MGRRMRDLAVNLLVLGLAAYLIYAFIKYWSISVQVFATVVMFLFVAAAPICRECESTWIYVLTMILSIMPNIKIAIYVLGRTTSDVFQMSGPHIFYTVVFYIALLQVEEVIMGILSRILWRRQLTAVKKDRPKEKVIDFTKMDSR